MGAQRCEVLTAHVSLVSVLSVDSRSLPLAVNKERRGKKNRDKCKLQRIEGTFTDRDNEMKSKKKKEQKEEK
jgi:hypothetical protein